MGVGLWGGRRERRTRGKGASHTGAATVEMGDLEALARVGSVALPAVTRDVEGRLVVGAVAGILRVDVGVGRGGGGGKERHESSEGDDG